MRPVIFALLATIGLSACEDKKGREAEMATIEAFGLSGTCREDHVQNIPENTATYEGSISRIRDDESGKVFNFGHAERTEAMDTKKITEEALHPDRYYPADSIEFFNLDAIDPTAERLILKGTSDRGTEEQRANDSRVHGYPTTCDMKVLKRGKEAAEVDPWLQKMDKLLSDK